MRARYYENGEETEHEVEDGDDIPSWLKWILLLTFAFFVVLMLL